MHHVLQREPAPIVKRPNRLEQFDRELEMQTLLAVALMTERKLVRINYAHVSRPDMGMPKHKAFDFESLQLASLESQFREFARSFAFAPFEAQRKHSTVGRFGALKHQSTSTIAQQSTVSRRRSEKHSRVVKSWEISEL